MAQKPNCTYVSRSTDETLFGREKSFAYDPDGSGHRPWIDIDRPHANTRHFRLLFSSPQDPALQRRRCQRDRLGDTNDGDDGSHRLSELQFTTEKRFRLCRHACRLEGHQLYGERLKTFSPGNLAAESRVQATEPQAGFHIALSSYRTEL